MPEGALKQKRTPRNLHIGGTSRLDGWEVLNANPAPYVDHVGNANDLSRFSADTFDAIYASHVMEHFDYKTELKNALIDWRRVLVPGGRLYISVPDMDVLARLFLDRERLGFEDRFEVMRMIFGGHIDRYDYHVVGLNEELLSFFLGRSGFVKIRRVPELGLFDDMSTFVFNGVSISLNMLAEKAPERERDRPLGRNALCHCGSGKKFKHCHGKIV
jgi:predicted SAM-dependent methyltransferase